MEQSPLPTPMAEHGSTDHPSAAHLPKTLKLPSTAWVLYDLANTVYVATLTFIFVPYLGRMFDLRSIVGIVSSLSMVCAGLLVPVFAAMADRTGRCRLYLVIGTVACIIPMALFGATESLLPVMALFFLANLSYNASLVFYNSLLPSVAADRNQGLVSGLGVGLGYIGSLLTLAIVLDLPDTSLGHRGTFLVAAGMFLLFALPSFLLVKERRVTSRDPFSLALVRRQFRSVVNTIRSLPKTPAIMWFLIGNFFCVDVLNTAILFFGDLTMGSFTPAVEAGEASLFGVTFTNPVSILKVGGFALNGLALLFGVSLGFLTDKLGSLRVLRFSALCLVVGLLTAAFAAGNSVLGYLIGICGFGGLGLAGIWTAGRKLLIELSPREKVGEYFGLYGITTKLSVMGALIFGILKDAVSSISNNELLGWQVAIGAQVIPLGLGIFFLYKVKVPSRPSRPAA